MCTMCGVRFAACCVLCTMVPLVRSVCDPAAARIMRKCNRCLFCEKKDEVVIRLHLFLQLNMHNISKTHKTQYIVYSFNILLYCLLIHYVLLYCQLTQYILSYCQLAQYIFILSGGYNKNIQYKKGRKYIFFTIYCNIL